MSDVEVGSPSEKENRIQEVADSYEISKPAAKVLVETHDRLAQDTVTSAVDLTNKPHLNDERIGLALFDRLPGTPPTEPGKAYLITVKQHADDTDVRIPFGDTSVRELMTVEILDEKGQVVTKASLTDSANPYNDGIMVKRGETPWLHPGKQGEKDQYRNDPARRILTGEQSVYPDTDALHKHLGATYKGKAEQDMRLLANYRGASNQSEARYVVNAVDSVRNHSAS